MEPPQPLHLQDLAHRYPEMPADSREDCVPVKLEFLLGETHVPGIAISRTFPQE